MISNSYMVPETLKAIGLDKVLNMLSIITPYGKRAKEALAPYFAKDIGELKEILNNFEFFKNTLEAEKGLLPQLKDNLQQYKDLQGTFERLKAGEVLDEVEIYEIKALAYSLIKLEEILNNCQLKKLKIISLKPMSKLFKLLDPDNTGIKSFYIYDSYNTELSNIRQTIKGLESTILKESKKAREDIIKKFGVRIRPNGEITVFKNDSKTLHALANSQKVYLAFEGLNSFSYKVKSPKALNDLTLEIEDTRLKEEELELQVRVELSRKIKEWLEDVIYNTTIIGELDLLIGKYVLNIKINGVKPHLVNKPVIKIKEGRHIFVEKLLIDKGKKYTPIDLQLNTGVTLITGANMGGKTVTLKLIALIMVMAQLGLYVPAKEVELGAVDFIHLSIGDQQSIESGLSTFGAEIKSLQQAIERVNETGLILMDELARGTNPKEGYAISKGIIQYLKAKTTISVITSHFDGLSEIKEVKHLQVKGLKREEIDLEMVKLRDGKYDEGLLENHMDYSLIEVEGNQTVPKDAIFIAKLMGLNEDIILEAEKAIKKT